MGLGVELCVSRTAGLLDAVRGPGIGDTVIAPAPQRPYAEEVGAEPGRLRVGLLDVHPRGDFMHEDCVTAVRAAASMLEGLGHTVEPEWPACLADSMLPETFMALFATQMAMAARGFGETLGRQVTAHDLEPVNWVLVERAQRLSAVDYAAAQAAEWAFRQAATVAGRRLGPATHTDAGRAAATAERVRQRPRAPDCTNAAGWAVRRVHATVQHQRATGDQPAPAPQRRRPPHRHPARRRLRPRGPPHPHRLPTPPEIRSMLAASFAVMIGSR